jgi:hypothetical protein
MYPLLWIAKTNGYDITKLSVRQSFTRAARTLAEAEAVDLMYVRWATAHSALSGDTNHRSVTCVTAPGMDARLTDDDWGEARLRCLDVFSPESAKNLRFMIGAAALQRGIDERETDETPDA